MRMPFSTTSRRLTIGSSLVAALAASVMIPVQTASGHAFSGISSTVRWPNNTRINIYIPEHPTDADLNDDIRTGIERWATKLSGNNITFTFTMGNPPDRLPDNSVVVSYPETVTGNDENEGYGTCVDDGSNITGGSIEIERDNTSGAFARNLGMHEFGHVLGLDDDHTADGQPHNCMDHSVQTTGVQGFTERDCTEIESVYGSAEDGQNSEGGVEGTSQSAGPEQWEYIYDVQWTGGPVIPTFELDINAHPTQLDVIQVPPGWVLNYPVQVLDGARIPTPTPNTPKLFFHAAVPGAEFGPDNPVGQFRLISNLPPGPGRAHAMIQSTGTEPWTFFDVPVPTAPGGPGAIPAVSTWGVMAMLLLILIGGSLILRRRAAHVEA